MYDLTGDRAGILHEYSAIVEYEQKIKDVMLNVLELCGIANYDVAPICVLRNSTNYWDESEAEDDYYVPHTLEFGAGVSAYEILEKLVNLYPYWEIFFDVNGTFICQKLLMEEDTSFVVLADEDLRHFVISEDTSIDYSKVKNHIEVWGKDGAYYGEAKDETADSPFNVAAHKTMRQVFSGGNYDNIYDRYKDVDLNAKLLTEKITLEEEIADLTTTIQENKKAMKEAEASGDTIASVAIQLAIDLAETSKKTKAAELKTVKSKITANLDIKGDDMAKDWAEQLLYENCRLQDSITLQTILLPFLNDVNFKISYRSKADDIVKTYVVKSVSHDYSGIGSTTINAIRFYNENCSAYRTQLSTPVIISHTIDGMVVTVSVDEVPYAEQYNLYIDYKLSATNTGTTLSFTLPDNFEGEHTVTVTASAESFRESDYSDKLTLNFEAGIFIVTNNGEYITTNSGENIEIIEGE